MRIRSFYVVMTVALLVVAAAIPASFAVAQASTDDPALRQTIPSDQRAADDRATLAAGHVDIGPRLRGDDWTFMIHDDTGPAGGVWRTFDRTVFRLTDAARREVPDDPQYGFLGVPVGTPVYIAPQTQEPKVVWIGWNTQDPQVVRRVDRGVTMTLRDVRGPGDVIVYLQSGSFGEPEELWHSARPGRSTWVDVNTHAHANWVFTRPGVYLVRISVAADLRDGTTVTDTRDLRFAVGSATDPADAMSARWEADDTTDRTQPAAADDGDSGGSSWAIVLGVAGAGVIAGLVALLVGGSRAKRRARTSSADDDAPST